MVAGGGWWWSEVDGGAGGGGLGKKKEKVIEVISTFFGAILSTFGEMNKSSCSLGLVFIRVKQRRRIQSLLFSFFGTYPFMYHL